MNMETIIFFLDASRPFIKGFFFQARNGQDFNCIMESKEEKEDGITNDEEMKYAKQGQPFKK